MEPVPAGVTGNHFLFLNIGSMALHSSLFTLRPSCTGMALAIATAFTPGLMSAAETDSLKIGHMHEVVVTAVRAPRYAPYAVTNIGRTELTQHATTGQELPMLLARTPGIMAWSENGIGIGTTYMRIRGAADSRINVTLDGVALNSPEDQCVFWANMNSYASMLGSVQVQRGIGTSTNGDGAFGGTIALTSAAPRLTPQAEVGYSLGSYGTMHYNVAASTGLLPGQLALDAGWSQTQTDGYMHGTHGRSGSAYAALAWMPSEGFTLRYRNIANYEHTGQAWNGATAGNDDSSLMDGMYVGATGIHTYKDMYARGLGRYNSLYEGIVYDPQSYAFPTDAAGNYLTRRYAMSDGSLWSRTTDNFNQDHNLLTAVWQLSDHWQTTATLHYTYGYGYYDEFRPNNKLSKFGLSNLTLADGSTLKRTDFVRQKGLEQHTYGFVWNTAYADDRWEAVGGVAAQQFKGDHFGHLTYVANEELRAKVLANGRYTYYDSDAEKSDASAFIKATRHIGRSWSVYADVQYRDVHFRTWGINDKFYAAADGYHNQGLDIDRHYHFVNPKAGVSYHHDGHHAYASVAHSHREPERNNFTDNGSMAAPRAEQLVDYELGYSYSAPTWHAGLNAYYMDYTDQFVQTGAQSDIGEALTTNIRDSYRLGLELTAGAHITQWLSLEGNAALSSNRIKDFDEVVEDWEHGSQTVHYDHSTLAFSPSLLMNGFLRAHVAGFEATWHTNYVARQFLDNTACRDRSLPAYSTSNLHMQYTMAAHRFAGLREVVVGAHLNNIFNHHYAASGWVYSAICESDGFTADHRYYQIGFIPMAGFTAMGSVTLRF